MFIIRPTMELAVQKGDYQRVQMLIRSGVGVNGRLPGSSSSLLMVAIRKSYRDIALALLAAGADVHAKDARGWTALHWACERELVEVVQALLDRGSRVDEPSAFGFTPLRLANDTLAMCLLRAGASCSGLPSVRMNRHFRHACHVGDLLNVRTLLENGCSVVTLSKEEQGELLHCACDMGDLLVAQALLENGCSLVTLSREEQDKLLHCACREGNTLVVQTLLQNDCITSRLTHAQLFNLASQLPKLQKEGLLHWACVEGSILVVEALLAAGCSVNCVGSNGDTPLMNAAHEGHEEVVKKLILAGANVVMQNKFGGTALHYAANHNHIQCGILLAEGGASVRARNIFSLTPLEVTGVKTEFKEAIKQAVSFSSQKTLCVIGNAGAGKSTLIASLQAERSGFLGRIINRFKRVADCRKRTAGIETVPHCSHKYGEVIFFDFAGQDDYRGPHQMFLESFLTKPGVSMTLLLVVRVTEEEDAILHQLHRWLTPVALMATTDSPPHVIVIGSFLDKVKPKREATDKLIRCILATKRNLEGLPLRFVGTCFLNCRQPQSEGIKQLCALLQEVPIPEFRAAHTRYSLAWVLSQIRSSITVQAVQLQDFSAWLKGNEDNLPQTLPTPEEVCQDLSAAGHALYLPNKEDPNKSWLVLDLPSILHDVYGTLFSQSKEIANEFGLLHCHHLDRLFPDLDLAMVQQLLIGLEFCIPVDPSISKVNLIELTQSEESSGWLFFPALISANPPQPTSEDLPEQSVHYLCWQLRTSKKHSISACILQTILLRLASHFVVKQRNEEGVQQHCCSIWWNGITWKSTVGVDITVYIRNNRVIQVIAASTMADELCQYMVVVVSDILSTVCRLSPKLAAAAYIVHPPKVATSPEDITAKLPKELFPVEGIRDSIRDHRDFVLSLKESGNDVIRVSVANLFGGFAPSLENIERIIWAQPVPNQPQSPTESHQPDLYTEGNGAFTDSESVPLGAQALLDTSSTPDMRYVDELVVREVAAHWQRLALRLGVKGCVSEIIFKNLPSDYEGACRDMLNRWLRGEQHTGEEERTWSTLLTALGRAGFVELESRLRREHFKKK